MVSMGVTVVLGLGKSGRAAASALADRGYDVIAVDDCWGMQSSQHEHRALVDRGVRCGTAIDWTGVDRLVVSPGIPPMHPQLAEARRRGIAVIGEMELGLSLLPNPCVAVTGTNGKTTVTLLCVEMLRAAGISARAVGNIGVPVSSLQVEPEEVLVVELSSFQIDTMHSPRFCAAVLLNLSADHLDRYGSMKAYATSKARLAQLLLPGGPFWVQDQVYQNYPDVFQQANLALFGNEPSSQLRCDSAACLRWGDTAYPFPEAAGSLSVNDRLNVAAALLLATEVGACPQACLLALLSFRKPEHRVEFVSKSGGVCYFNDSKGTNVDAVIHAVQCVPGTIRLIVGGRDKGGSYQPWLHAFRGRVIKIYAIGEASDRIASSLESEYDVQKCGDLETAIGQILEDVSEGESVLLSPGCSSYDQFQNYEERGRVFKRLLGERLGEREYEPA